jgi:hypothetical protein
MNSRLLRLTLALVLGAAVGLAYGWLVQPVKYVDTAPASLRADYRTDYVLMAAEAFQADGNLEAARVRLAALGPQSPLDIVAAAIEYTVAHGADRTDLDTLNRLAIRLRAALPTPEIGSP